MLYVYLYLYDIVQCPAVTCVSVYLMFVTGRLWLKLRLNTMTAIAVLLCILNIDCNKCQMLLQT